MTFGEVDYVFVPPQVVPKLVVFTQNPWPLPMECQFGQFPELELVPITVKREVEQ